MIKNIEILYPELHIYGEQGNSRLLQQALPEANIRYTTLDERPFFADNQVDMLYLGSTTESGQLRIINHLRQYNEVLQTHFHAGTTILATGNALEIFGTKISNETDNTSIPALDWFPYETKYNYWKRYDSPIVATTNSEKSHTLTGHKNQFSFCYPDTSGNAIADVQAFATIQSGFGRNLTTKDEGYRAKGFIGTHILGPLLILNPTFTLSLLTQEEPINLPFTELLQKAEKHRLHTFKNQ